MKGVQTMFGRSRRNDAMATLAVNLGRVLGKLDSLQDQVNSLFQMVATEVRPATEEARDHIRDMHENLPPILSSIAESVSHLLDDAHGISHDGRTTMTQEQAAKVFNAMPPDLQDVLRRSFPSAITKLETNEASNETPPAVGQYL